MDVRYCYNLVAGLVKQLGTDTTHISRALHDYTRLAGRHLEPLDTFVYNKHYAATRGFAPSGRAAEVDGLARHHCVYGMPRVHGVGVHDPRHRLLVGIHVRRGHVFFWSNEV